MSCLSARAYVAALEKLFLKSADFIHLIEDIKLLNHVMDKQTIDFFCSPLIALHIKKQVLKNSMSGLSEFIKNFLFILIDKNQFYLWPEILEDLLEKEREIKKITVAQVESAMRLEKTTLHKIQDQLERFFNRSVEIKTLISPELLGGIKIRAGGKILDDTLFSHLANMQKERGTNGYPSG